MDHQGPLGLCYFPRRRSTQTPKELGKYEKYDWAKLNKEKVQSCRELLSEETNSPFHTHSLDKTLIQGHMKTRCIGGFSFEI